MRGEGGGVEMRRKGPGREAKEGSRRRGRGWKEREEVFGEVGRHRGTGGWGGE